MLNDQFRSLQLEKNDIVAKITSIKETSQFIVNIALNFFIFIRGSLIERFLTFVSNLLNKWRFSVKSD